MDFQTILDNAIAKERQESLQNSDRLTLGEIITKVEKFAKAEYEDGKEPEVMFDFEYNFPVDLTSWRGVYRELALTYETYRDNGREPMKITKFLELLKSAIGKTFEGYKGGNFKMSRHTPVWVANWGNSGSTAIIDVIEGLGYSIILVTGYRP